MAVSAIPEGYHSVTPYMVFKDAAAAIDFYKRAFGATEIMCMSLPTGGVAHAEIRVGNSPIMLADECPEMKALSPGSVGGSPISMLIYVEDADAAFRQALDAGATEVRPLRDQFYGDRSGTLADPFGYTWTIATHIEDVSPEEMDARFEKMMAESAAQPS